VNVILLRQFGQRLFALDGSQCHFRLDPTSTLWTSLSRETRGRPRVLRVSIEVWC
jgi:hypothetical protein